MTGDECSTTDKQSLGQNYHIRCNHQKSLKFADVTQILEYYKSRDTLKNFTALLIIFIFILNYREYR